ncbi:MAG: protein phosphatase 2C domain-containing protein, partial [Gemmatales bacterium]|nr:protein phosphatase 2C domain-containing protein [Gemmatales bacterium]
DRQHDRSDEGACLGVEAAVGELSDLSIYFGAVSDASRLIQAFKQDFPRRVTRRWREAVRLRASESHDVGSDDDISVLRRFGTTLTAAVWWKDRLAVAQIGDSSAFLVRPDGEVDSVFRSEPNVVGLATDSLCSVDADKRWLTAVPRCPVGTLFLTVTDGLVNAFAQEKEVLKFARSLGDRIRDYGIAEVAKALPGWLDEYSEKGSGDDITVVGVYRRPGVSPGQVSEPHGPSSGMPETGGIFWEI